MNQFDQAPVNGEAIEESIAIVCNGNTAPKAIAAGQYLFIKNHSTLATGGYHATAAIASGDTLSSSNVTSDPDGIANAINGNIPAVVNNLTSDSTTDALSAAQGKALNSNITSRIVRGGSIQTVLDASTDIKYAIVPPITGYTIKAICFTQSGDGFNSSYSYFTLYDRCYVRSSSAFTSSTQFTFHYIAYYEKN